MSRIYGALVTILAVAIGFWINRPFFADVAYQRGQTEINMGRPSAGMPFLWRALAIDPHDARAAQRIVWTEREMGHASLALVEANSLLKRFPSFVPLQRERARTLFVLKRYGMSAPAFARILQTPESIVNDALYAMISYDNIGRRDRGAEMLRIGLVQHPNSAILRRAVGVQ